MRGATGLCNSPNLLNESVRADVSVESLMVLSFILKLLKIIKSDINYLRIYFPLQILSMKATNILYTTDI